jgi:hypothetical protein
MMMEEDEYDTQDILNAFKESSLCEFMKVWILFS